MAKEDKLIMQEKTYDKRVIKRNMKKGSLNPKEYEKHLKGLEDVSGNLEVINVEDDNCDTMPTTEDYKD
jgi:hypothetical protein